MRKLAVCTAAALLASAPLAASSGATEFDSVRSLDGSGNNVLHPDWGKVGTRYIRVAAPNYADGIQKPVAGPRTRYVSNRIFNDVSQNLFSENDISHWGFAWGQFMDHVFGLRQETGGENAPIAFNANDPLEEFTNDFGAISFSRTPAAPFSGVTSPRQQINTVSSYIDAWNVYGGTNERLAWLRDDNLGTLMLPNRYLPRVTARGDASSAPTMGLMGRLMLTPDRAIVAGDVRANENIALTAVHTLFAREHNRIVAKLPDTLSEETKFQIARRVVGAEEQYITYNEFLPALGVRLTPYAGYNVNVNASLSNEFAAVGYRAHSMIHGELEPIAAPGRYSDAQIEKFEAQGIEVTETPEEVVLGIAQNIAFGNPDLLRAVGLGPVLAGLGGERQYRNDEQIDNQLRSVLFQVPKPGVDPSLCSDGTDLPDCFNGVADLAAIDIERGRDHGMPYYNALRVAYGLAPKLSFPAITGESTARFPDDPMIDPTNPLDDPNILDFVELRDRDGNILELGSDEAADEAVSGKRRSTVAARLRALYGDVNKVDAFVGMSAEPHVPGTEFGELQLAIWKKQFEALRNGDRFFYASDPVLDTFKAFGIDYKRTLAQIIEANTGANVQANVFKVAHVAPPPSGGSIVRINAGGPAVNASSGAFVADTSFSGGFTYSTGASIGNTTDPALYQTERYGQFTYSIPVENGPYDVRLHFAEIYFGTQVPGDCVGKRVFGMDVLDTSGVDITNLDICKLVGPRQALVRAINGVTVTDGTLDVKSIPGVENPKLSAIEVVPAGSVPPPPPPLTPVFLVGNKNVETQADPNDPGLAEAFKTSASTSGSLQSFSVYVDATSTATSLVAGLYADSGGHPGVLLTQGTLSGPIATGWNTVTAPAASVTAGTSYWIALLAPSGTLVFRDRCCGAAGTGPTETSAVLPLAVLPALWTPGTTYPDGPMSAYGTS